MAKSTADRSARLGSAGEARHSRGVIRRIVAVSFLVLVTVLMWSDVVIEWWQSTLAWLLEANESATQSVLDARPANDMDLHILVWAATAWAMAWGFASRRWRMFIFVGVWSLLVEFLQPVFTDMRASQTLDYVGNLIGVSVVALGFMVVALVREGVSRARR